MKAKLIKVEDVYRLCGENNSIIGTTDKEYQRAFSDVCGLLSLSNCQEIEIGFDLTELSNEVQESIDFSEFCITSFRLGFEKCLNFMSEKRFDECEWDVNILYENEEPTPFIKRNVVRKLENGEEINWKCFWDKGWWDSSSKVSIPNVVSWERKPILDSNDCLILKRI